MANTRNGGSSKSSSTSSSRKSATAGDTKSGASASSSSNKSKSLRPLSSVLGFSSGISSPPKKSTTTSPVVKSKTKKTKVGKSSNKSSDPVDPIELSSDDDNDEVDDFLEIKDDSSATEHSDDEVLITGYSAASASSSKSAPTSTISKKATSSQVTPKAIAKTDSSKVNDSPARIASTKSQGKQKAVESSFVELQITDTREGALWSQKYEPVDFESLCVHKKKVQDVQRWLEEAYAGGVTSKYRRILILSGSAGSAKTATLRVLSREMDIDVVEYKTSEGDSESFSNQFPSFLAKATVSTSLQFGVLTSDNKIAVPKASSSKSSDNAESSKKANSSTLNDFTVPKASTFAATPHKRRKLILVEDLPNIFTSQGTRTAFRNALTSFATSKRFTSIAPNANVPLVLIVSEALTRPGQNEGENAANRYQGSGEQSVSVRSVVPPDVLRAPVAAEFKFNPIAPTLMKKALNAILDREYESSSSKRPSQRAVQLVIEASDGDIRSALNTLQFIVGDAAPISEVALENAKKKGKKRKSSGKAKDDEGDESANKALLHLVATKESSLFLFHALGKVLFNKRWGENPDEDAKSTHPIPPKPEKLPSHLKAWERRVTKVDANALFSDAPVDSDMFMAYLHQNYPPFCNNMEDCANLMEYTSISDSIMRMEGDNFSRHALTSHYSFQVSVRGALMSLPTPVQRRGQKMYKSELWETQRKARENMERIGDWMVNSSRSHNSTEDGEDLLPKRLLLQLETIPYMGLMQAPQKSFLAALSPSSSSGNPFKQPKAPSSLGHAVPPSDNRPKLSAKLLDIAMFPVPAFMKAPNPDERTFKTREALNEKDVPDDDEAEEDDEMKRKPTAPAVKIEQDDDAEYNVAHEEEPLNQKMYLSDDDIGDF